MSARYDKVRGRDEPRELRRRLAEVERKLKRYPLTLNRAGAVRAGGTLHLFVAGITGTSACRAVFNYAEVR